MRIINYTHYRTAMLGKICRKICKELGATDNEVKTIELHYRKTRRQHKLGDANMRRKRIRIYMGKDLTETKWFVGTLKHEIFHLFGVNHKEMYGGKYVIPDMRYDGVIMNIIRRDFNHQLEVST